MSWSLSSPREAGVRITGQRPQEVRRLAERETIMAMAVTLDWLLERFPAPNVLKIDVEGAKHKVLRGAQKLPATNRPNLLFHQSPGGTDILGAHDYRMFDLEVVGNERAPLQLPAFNTLAAAYLAFVVVL